MELETKDEEVVACIAMKVCVFYYCLICVSIPIDPFLTVVRCKRKKTKWRRGGAKKDTK